jgi:hypothetical protein
MFPAAAIPKRNPARAHATHLASFRFFDLKQVEKGKQSTAFSGVLVTLNEYPFTSFETRWSQGCLRVGSRIELAQVIPCNVINQEVVVHDVEQSDGLRLLTGNRA